MKKISLVSIIFVFFFSSYSMESQEISQAPLEHLPADIKMLISRNLIEVDPLSKPYDLTDFYKSINNITSYARLNRKFRSAINDPDNTIWLVKTLANRFKNKFTKHFKESPKQPVDYIDEIFIAKGLANMPGIKSAKFQNWLNRIVKQQEFNTAVSELNVEKVKELIAQGVDVNAQDRYNASRLHALILALNFQVLGLNFPVNDEQATARAIEILKLLMNKGADINVQGTHGYTPILLATMYQNIPLMQEILKYNPDLSLADTAGQTAFHFAAATPNRQIMETLLEYVKKNGVTLSPEIKEMTQAYISE